MLFTTPLAAVVTILVTATASLAVNSFAGANLYYAAGLSTDEQNTLFSGMQAGEKLSHYLSTLRLNIYILI